MKKVKIKDGAHVFIVNEKGDVLLGKHTHHQKKWGFFGGGMEQGEVPYGTLCREVEEEIGIDITEYSPVYIGKRVVPRGGQGENVVFLFRAKMNNIKKIIVDPSEIEEVAFFSKEEVFHNPENNILENTQKLYRKFLEKIYS